MQSRELMGQILYRAQNLSLEYDIDNVPYP